MLGVEEDMAVHQHEKMEIRKVAIGCYLILRGRATPSFPTSSRSHPSHMVVVTLNTPNDPYAGEFPFQIQGTEWRKVVAPLLEDPAWKAEVMNRESTDVIERITLELLTAYMREGYLYG